MDMNDNGPDKEPDWMNPANDRKTPYTDEEIDTFVAGFYSWPGRTRMVVNDIGARRRESKENNKSRFCKNGCKKPG